MVAHAHRQKSRRSGSSPGDDDDVYPVRDDDVYYYIRDRDDDDVYYYIRWIVRKGEINFSRAFAHCGK